ncbi:hypothetical protein BH11ACT1_BH11ACT1_01170 [soil metagenome]
MTGLALMVTHTLLAGHEAAFDALVERTVASIRALEPGTIVYVSHTAADNPRLRVFYELYRDAAAFTAHEQYPHMTVFLADRMAHIESVDVQRLDVQTAHSSAAALP